MSSCTNKNCFQITSSYVNVCFFSSSLPTDIQAESIPLILGGGDVLMVSMQDSPQMNILCALFPSFQK